MEDKDKVMEFIEEFIKRQTSGKSKDQAVFNELSETDKESINDVLRGFGIAYKEVF